MQSSSGTDPHGSFLEFLKKDPRQNIDVHRDFASHTIDLDQYKERWAIGTTKMTLNKVSSHGLLDRTKYTSQIFPRNKTDNISFDPPAIERPFQRIYDEMVTKPKYNINVKSTNEWEPFKCMEKTINNRSSVGHNIISHDDNKYTPGIVLSLLDKQVINRKKGIGEYTDLHRLTAVNTNIDHLKAFNENSSIFKRKDGPFTHLYDAAHRFGDNKPFKA